MILWVILLVILVLPFLSIDQMYVAAPGIASVVIALWLWMSLWAKDNKLPFFDIGMFCVLATLVYTVYPLINYWAGGLQFSPGSDLRLASYYIEPAELGVFHLRHVLYLFFLVASYLMFRGKGDIKTGNVALAPSSVQRAILISFFLLTCYFFLLRILFGANFNASYTPSVYSGTTVAFAQMPLFLVQLSQKLWGILFLFKLAVLYLLIQRCQQKKWFVVLVLWVVFETIQVLYIKGSRTNYILFVMAVALLYYRLVKPFTAKFLISAGTTLLALFLFMGIYRPYSSIEAMREDFAYSDTGVLVQTNEFQALLGTAYDVFQRKSGGAQLPLYLYFNDFINVLPPQQIIPFEKVPASEWYLREIGISGTGQGFMWGVVSQAIIGLDWVELALRGLLLGFILGRFHRWYLAHQTNFLPTLIYTFFCLKVYYTFRDTTGSLLTNLFWEVIPLYLLLRVYGLNSVKKYSRCPVSTAKVVCK